ncbi:MAG: flagellar export protein FliJ [Lachnospiraceae bacterium]|nr:flagellar export protein FliJ [Lachnospiraceae bacterium]MBQ2576438.1 flagellar export protein FliJ [Lachnospiraceae bacterium]MCR4732521.1 flagellar export protein FliJ [Lachnospiraceae bacterium]MEE3355462.1 flagellar export protein FliJ [Candidatus Weimeria sp.]
MAKFRYRMQNVLDLKMLLETQEKAAYAQAQLKVNEEQEKLQQLLLRRARYEQMLHDAQLGPLDLKEIQRLKNSIMAMKTMIRDQMFVLKKAQTNLEAERRKLDEIMKDRKTHEKLKEKAFETFKQELASEDNKITDELVSFTYHRDQ